jgi:hypothetical protein
VTDQVCWSHSRGGVVKSAEGWLYLMGDRMVILDDVVSAISAMIPQLTGRKLLPLSCRV